MKGKKITAKARVNKEELDCRISKLRDLREEERINVSNYKDYFLWAIALLGALYIAQSISFGANIGYLILSSVGLFVASGIIFLIVFRLAKPHVNNFRRYNKELFELHDKRIKLAMQKNEK